MPALCLLPGVAAIPAPAVTLTFQQNAHAPGAIVKDGGICFNFTTGTGVWYSRSKDPVNWNGGPR